VLQTVAALKCIEKWSGLGKTKGLYFLFESGLLELVATKLSHPASFHAAAALLTECVVIYCLAWKRITIA
jgi:hypothetical protein